MVLSSASLLSFLAANFLALRLRRDEARRPSSDSPIVAYRRGDTGVRRRLRMVEDGTVHRRPHRDEHRRRREGMIRRRGDTTHRRGDMIHLPEDMVGDQDQGIGRETGTGTSTIHIVPVLIRGRGRRDRGRALFRRGPGVGHRRAGRGAIGHRRLEGGEGGGARVIRAIRAIAAAGVGVEDGMDVGENDARNLSIMVGCA